MSKERRSPSMSGTFVERYLAGVRTPSRVLSELCLEIKGGACWIMLLRLLCRSWMEEGADACACIEGGGDMTVSELRRGCLATGFVLASSAGWSCLRVSKDGRARSPAVTEACLPIVVSHVSRCWSRMCSLHASSLPTVTCNRL